MQLKRGYCLGESESDRNLELMEFQSGVNLAGQPCVQVVRNPRTQSSQLPAKAIHQDSTLIKQVIMR